MLVGVLMLVVALGMVMESVLVHPALALVDSYRLGLRRSKELPVLFVRPKKVERLAAATHWTR